MSGAGPSCGVPDGRHAPGCVTCADAAVWMRVVAVDADNALAHCVDEGGHSETVATELVGAVAPDDALLVHAGTAIHREGRSTAAPVQGGER